MTPTLVPRLPAAMAHVPNAVYYDFNCFMTSALTNAINRANKLASLDRIRHLPLSLSLPTTIFLSNLLSHVSGVFLIITGLINSIGFIVTLAIITILVAIPIWLLSTALASFFGGNPALTCVCVATLGIGFLTTIRKLGQEKDILIAFRDDAQELSTAYGRVKFKDEDEFQLATQTLGSSDRSQDIEGRVKVLLPARSPPQMSSLTISVFCRRFSLSVGELMSYMNEPRCIIMLSPASDVSVLTPCILI
jgi:hypothetical protein